MVVGRNTSPFPLGIAIRFGRQWLERRAVDRLEQLAPALTEFAHDLRIELGDALADGDVELIKREEAPVAQPRQHESLNDLHRHFRFLLVARLFDPRRQHNKTVMGGELLIGAIDAWLVARRLGDARFKVVADHRPRHAADGGERIER